MHLDGTHTLNASPEEVWNLLLDHEILGRITPGVKTLEPRGDDQYQALFEVKMGPVSGTFQGTMEVADKSAPQRFTLKMQLSGKIGNVSAESHIGLKALDSHQTEISFSGDARLAGTIARTGQRVINGVAKTMTNQFFKSLEQELAASRGIIVEKIGFWTRIKQWFKKLFGKKDS